MNIKELILKEFCNLIDEARSHPELNKKESVYEQIKKYIDSSKEYYISFTSIDKIGINPRSKYNTPIGIYTYPLREIYESYENTNSDWDKNTNIQVPFPPKNRWKNIYVLEKNPNGKYIDVSEYSSKDYDNDRESLVAEFGEQVIRNCESDMHSKAKYKSPGGYFWYVTYMLCKPYDNVPVRWNKILRKVLGYDGITDKDGYGIIHNAEPIQAVFFTAKSFKVVDKIEYKETMSNDDLFKKHLKHNKIAIIKNMINKDMVDPSADENFAIRYASDNGHHEVVEFLLQDERVDPSAENNYAIRRASENGHLEIVKLLLQDKRVDPSVRNNHAIRFASENGHLEVVKLLLQDKRVDPSVRINHAFRFASQNGHLEVVKLLIQDKRVDPSADDNHAIIWASENGHLEVVKLLLQDSRVDPSADENFAIRYASGYGHLEIVKLLLQDKRVDPSDDNNYAIRYASENGHTEVVKLLLQDGRVDPSTDDNYAIRFASYKGHHEIVKLLLQDKRIKNSLSKEQIEEYEKQIGK